MSHYAEQNGTPVLNPAGMQAVDQVVAIRKEVKKRFGTFNDDLLNTMTLAAVIAAAGNLHVVHDPRDPMSRAG